MRTADVSQFIQMNRLRSLENNKPKKIVRSSLEFYQKSFPVDTNNKFLPNSNTKFTHASTIQKFPLYKGIQAKYKIPTRNVWGGTVITSTYSFKLYAGTPNTAGNTTSTFITPEDLIAFPNGDLYVVTGGDKNVRYFNSLTSLISTFNITTPLLGDANGIVDRGGGNILVTNSTLSVITNITSTGISSIFGLIVGLSTPTKLLIDTTDLYVVDRGNFVIKKILLSTNTVTTIIGNGSFEAAGGGANSLITPQLATSVPMGQLQGICKDSLGNFYVSDSSLNRILKYETSTSQISLFAGNNNPVGDNPGFINGSAYTARFSSPYGLAIDSSNNIYVADFLNAAIRKITPTGVVSTLSTPGLVGPKGVFCDKLNNILYIADTNGSAIYKITL